jgi:hypothetical protein
MGPSIKKWLSLLGNQREACILLDNGKKSKSFPLRCGRPQGDNISPNTFNFANQILIFKIELDPRIDSIPRLVPVQPINQVPNFFSQESNRETEKNESLADDNTTITMLNYNSLNTVKNILTNFADISGLSCNFDKSCIMPTLPPEDEDERLVNSFGFQMVDSFKLLGVTISRDLDTANETFSKVKIKITNLIRFWERFKLSFPGRITIAKTFLVSQLNYVGCFLPVPAQVLEDIQMLIDGFVKKNCLISRERMHRRPEVGGAGMFELRNFLQAQKCCWLTRAINCPIDNWQFDLIAAVPLNQLELLRPVDIDPNNNPLLYSLAVSYRHFYGEFTKVNGNYREAYIFDNPAFRWGPDFTATFTKDTLGAQFYRTHYNRIRTLTYQACFINENFKSQAQFHLEGLPLSFAAWMQLRTCILHARDLLKKPDPVLDAKCIPIRDFLRRGNGSKKFRTILDMNLNSNISLRETRTVQTYFNLIEVPVPCDTTLRTLISNWNTHNFNNSLREFLFKLRNNQLSLNNRINAFDPNIDPRCTFCRIADNMTRIRESFRHVFFSCPFTTNILNDTLAFFFELVLTQEEFVDFYWSGTLADNDNLQNFFIFFWDMVRFVVYRYKTFRRNPNPTMTGRDIIFQLSTNIPNKMKVYIQREVVLARMAQRLE